jgi:hypothetical protein
MTATVGAMTPMMALRCLAHRQAEHDDEREAGGHEGGDDADDAGRGSF